MEVIMELEDWFAFPDWIGSVGGKLYKQFKRKLTEVQLIAIHGPGTKLKPITNKKKVVIDPSQHWDIQMRLQI